MIPNGWSMITPAFACLFALTEESQVASMGECAIEPMPAFEFEDSGRASVTQANEKKFDFFISYADADRAWAEGVIADALRQAGFECLTQSDFAAQAGKPLLVAFEEAVTSSRRIVLVISPAYMADEFARFSDLLAQHYGVELGTWPVIPLLYQPVVDLPLRIRMLNSIDATRDQDWDAAIQILIGQKPPSPREIPPPPYRGLRPYTEGDSPFFHGREREIEDVVVLLRAHPFLALIGPSGSGKSSLVFAGVLPAIRKSQIFGAGTWAVRHFRPGSDPWMALTEVLGGDPELPDVTIPSLLAVDAQASRLLLIVDQFEELFTLDGKDVSRFQTALVDLTRHPAVKVLLTVRADFYPSLMASPIWKEIQGHRYEVPALGETAMAEAVRKPADKVGVYIEAALVERLVNDARDEPGVMPFVQETMILLWEKIVRRYLPLSAYDALVLPRSAYDKHHTEKTTGLEAAIAIHADKVLKELDPSKEVLARRIFLRLVQFGEGRSDTRRQQPLSALQVSSDPIEVTQIVDYLANDESRLLIKTGREEDPIPRVDISHEALLTAPSILLDWIEEGRSDELIRRDVQADAQKWTAENNNPSYLYESAQLQQAQKWADRFHAEIEPSIRSFLDASTRHDIQLRRQRQTFLVLVGLFALFGLVSGVYFIRLEMLRQSARGPMYAFPEGQAVLGYGSTRVEVELPAFELDQFEVTNRQYDQCVQAERCTPPNQPYIEGEDDVDPEWPVAWVTAYQAASFCDWVGRRLPTVVEWERAVRGIDGRTWPWGEESPLDPKPRVKIFLPELPEITPLDGPVEVDSSEFALGASPEGIWHLLGNVSEWTSTHASYTTCPDPYQLETCQIWDGKSVHVQSLFIVGLGWGDDLLSSEPERVSEYYPSSPVQPSAITGFRCAKSQP